MGYSKKHLVIFEEPNGTRNRHITITFDGSPCLNKNLSVRLSDEDDLYFLYTTTISEEDFITIKSQQGLLVDFAGFRQRVVDLLRQCSNEEASAVPKYMLKFSRSFDADRSGVLQIVEATNFKYLTHLSLNLLAGDDETLKAYLVGQVKLLKIESKQTIDSLETRVTELTSKLSNTELKYESTLKELDTLKLDYRNQETLLKKELQEKIDFLEDKYQKSEKDLKDSLAREQRLTNETCENVRTQFTSKLEDYKRTNQELVETRDRLQANVRDLTGQVAMLETENTSAKEHLNSTRSQLSSAEQICQNQSATISRLESRIAALDQDAQLRDQSLAKAQELLNDERVQKTKLQDELQAQTCRSEQLQQSLDKQLDEVKKANEIIKHLQTEVKSHHTKAKLRGQVAAEQERLLSAKESELHDRSSELDRLRSELRKASESIASLTSQLNQTTADLGDAQRTIKTNENIIGWLNRQISESQIGQVQQRLRSSGLVAANGSSLGGPLPSYSPSHFTTSTTGNNNRLGTTLAPAWHPSTASRLTTTPSTLPSSTLNHLGMNSCELPLSTVPCNPSGDTRTSFPSHTDSIAKTVKTTSIPAPITKSTPLHGDQSTTRPTTNAARFDLGSGVASTRLPSYIPSTIVTKVRSTQPVAPTGTAPSTAAGHQTLAAAAAGEERALQQQSLTSAYFPKSVVGGTGAHS